MSWHIKDPLRSPLARVRNLGSAHEGSHHHFYQRFTAVTLVFLSVWFIVFLNNLPLSGSAKNLQLGVFVLLQSPWNVSFLTAFVGISSYHGFLGVQTIIEDYFHGKIKWIILLLVKWTFAILGLVGIISVLKMSI